MKKSKSPAIRIKRAVTELKGNSNGYELGTFILEQIIINGMKELEEALDNGDLDRSIISPNMYRQTIMNIKSHINCE
jgi:hypothetical protein|tara:strand:+ start:355 stop:585 length:231 start_codon:yes stop_codon:yes gene_type:complete